MRWVVVALSALAAGGILGVMFGSSVELESSDWVAAIAIVSGAVVVILSPVIASGLSAKKDKDARLEERRYDAYTRASRIIDDFVTSSGRLVNYPYRDVPPPATREEVSTMEAAVRIVGSEPAATALEKAALLVLRLSYAAHDLREELQKPDPDSQTVASSRAEFGPIHAELVTAAKTMDEAFRADLS